MGKIMPTVPDRLLSVRDLSELLQVPVKTLYQWRHRREGPQPMRIGRYLRYDPADVAQWLKIQKAVS